MLCRTGSHRHLTRLASVRQIWARQWSAWPTPNATWHCTALELEYVYKRFPHLPKVKAYDPEYRRPLDDCHSVNGAPASLERKYQQLERNAALLKDPSANIRRNFEATKPEPTKPEPSLMRTACHEIGHYLWLRAFKMPYARITVEPSGNILGSVLTPSLPDTWEGLMAAVAGAEAERVVFRNSRDLIGSDKENAHRIANAIAAAEGMTPDELIEDARAEAYDRLKELGAPFISRFAFTLVRRRHIDWEEIDTVADAAFRDLAREKTGNNGYVTR